jgi:hypothetical protein
MLLALRFGEFVVGEKVLFLDRKYDWAIYVASYPLWLPFIYMVHESELGNNR